MEVAKFLASKLDNVGVAPKKPLLKFSVDKKKMTVEIVNVNFLVNQFFRVLKTFFGFALGRSANNGNHETSMPYMRVCTCAWILSRMCACVHASVRI